MKSKTANTAKTPAKRFSPELLAEAAKLRETGLTWDAIGARLDVRSTGLLSKRVRDTAAAKKPAKRKPTRPAAKATPTTTPKEA